jgi:hypothetical protein
MILHFRLLIFDFGFQSKIQNLKSKIMEDVMDQIPLQEALMCVNCNTISRMPQRYCPYCAGEQLMPVSGWLNPVPARPKRPQLSLVRSLPAFSVDWPADETTEHGLSGITGE